MKYIKGDITKTELNSIAHGCNASGKMGSGVAKALFTKWPNVRMEYMKRKISPKDLGSYHLAICGEKYVFNCITQEKFGYDGGVYASKEAIRTSFEQLLNDVTIFNGDGLLNIAIPKIGAGLGGLNWENDVEPIFIEFENEYDVEFHIYYLDD